MGLLPQALTLQRCWLLGVLPGSGVGFPSPSRQFALTWGALGPWLGAEGVRPQESEASGMRAHTWAMSSGLTNEAQ